MKITSILVLIFLFIQVGFSQTRKGIPPEKPKLVVGIVIDQMRYDYLTRYWDKFGKGGFKKLVQEGANCKNTNLNYIFTQTGVGHATIFTGATPAVHGIVSNDWYVSLKNETVYCTEDPKVKVVGGKSENRKMSPKNLLTSTIGDEIKLSTGSKSKVIGISMKDRAAILATGHMADAAYWYDDLTGEWCTTDYYMDTLPKWVKKFNKKEFPELYLAKEWNTLLPMEEYSASLPDENSYETGFDRTQHVFPYLLDELTQDDRKKRIFKFLKYTPYGNTFTKDFAIAAIANENLGKDEFTDFLAVSFSPSDYVGHMYGPRAVEVEDLYLRLDKDLEHFLEFIETEVGKENVLVFLTADHGVADVPKFLEDQRMPGGVFRQTYAITLLKAYLNAVYGEGEWVKKYMEQQLYLNHELIENAKIPLAEIQDKCVDFMQQFGGVSYAVSATTLQKTNFTSGIPRMIQNNYYSQRCGDVLISLAPGYMEDIAYSTTHNSAYSYDTHVPLIWYGWKIRRNTIETPIEITDIAATISTLLGISFPNGCYGKPVEKLTQ